MKRRNQVMRAVVRVPIVCLLVLAFSIIAVVVGGNSLVIAALVLVGCVLAFPAWSGAIVAKMWRCPQCDKPLPITFGYGLVLPAESTSCPACELQLH